MTNKIGFQLLANCFFKLAINKSKEEYQQLTYLQQRQYRRVSSKRKRIREKLKLRKKQLKEIVRYEFNKPCTDCGRRLPGHMSFDHLPEFKKKFSPHDIGKCSFGKLFRELKKCQIVCCICHHIRERLRDRQGHSCRKGCQYYKVREFFFQVYQSVKL